MQGETAADVRVNPVEQRLTRLNERTWSKQTVDFVFETPSSSIAPFLKIAQLQYRNQHYTQVMHLVI